MAVSCLLGAIADDFTGGSDLAGMLRERGVSTVQLFGLPDRRLREQLHGRYQAVVLCLKSRSIPAEAACTLSLQALDCLKELGAQQIQFKYCSTFDSTVHSNIGPVAEALLGALGAQLTVAVPALPVNGRTQYLGHLFVHGELLSESPMRTHPLNPMADSNLVRHLQSQMQNRAGLIALPDVRQGANGIRERMRGLEHQGVRVALVDAVDSRDLAAIAEAVADLPLLTGGSGLAMHLPDVWRMRGLLKEGSSTGRVAIGGPTLILSGSCSAATLGQLQKLEQTGCDYIAVDVSRLTKDSPGEISRLALSAEAILHTGASVVVRSSAPAEARTAVLPEAASAIESAFGELARRLVCTGLSRRLIVAGGETAGAVVNALGITGAEVTGILDPGVPALRTLDDQPLALALKSGNFGSPDFFEKTIRWWDQNES